MENYLNLSWDESKCFLGRITFLSSLNKGSLSIINLLTTILDILVKFDTKKRVLLSVHIF